MGLDYLWLSNWQFCKTPPHNCKTMNKFISFVHAVIAQLVECRTTVSWTTILRLLVQIMSKGFFSCAWQSQQQLNSGQIIVSQNNSLCVNFSAGVSNAWNNHLEIYSSKLYDMDTELILLGMDIYDMLIVGQNKIYSSL